jgi:DNA replication protein DnaC
LRIPVTAEQFDRTLGQAEQEHLAPLEFLSRLIGEQANLRRQRSIERRIREAHFREHKTLEEFDWEFNASAIDRVQIEELATGEFIRRGDNLVLVGQSGVGKSHLMQALGVRFCAAGYRVRYTTSAELLSDLTASLADQTLPKRLRYWSRFDLVMIDEFGFDKIERSECPQAANLFYKIIDARSGRRSTALATNIDTDAWNDYLGDPPLAMAFYDRIAYRAIPLKIEGKSYRAHRAKRPSLRKQSPEE